MKVTFIASRNGYEASKTVDLDVVPREDELVSWPLGHGVAWRARTVEWTINDEDVTVTVHLA